MSIRTAMLRLANRMRALPSRSSIDVWTTDVTIRKRTWLGGQVGKDGGYKDEDLVITPRPQVRELSEREIRSSAGRYRAGDVLVEHITPAADPECSGGYTQEQLRPVGTRAIQIIYVLSGELTGQYSLESLGVDDVLSYSLHLRRTRTTP